MDQETGSDSEKVTDINSRDGSLGMTSEHFIKVYTSGTISQATGKPRAPENIDYMPESKEQ